MFEMRYNCPDCKRPGRSGFGGALPMLIINGIIIGVVLMWCLAIKIWSPKQDSILIENLNHDQKIADDIITMTRSNKRIMIKKNRNKSRPSTIFTVHQNKYNALELNAS